MISEPFDLTCRNSYRIAAEARRGIVPANAAELVEALRAEPDAIVIGSGHNLILRSARYDDTFIVASVADLNDDVCALKEDTLTAYAGVSMTPLSILAMEHGLAGLEMFYDIPSSLGGAVVMNAGASGEEIKDVLTDVTVFDRAKGIILTLRRDDIGYAYRQSIFQQRPELIVLSATLTLKAGNRGQILERMESIKEARWAKQPRDLPNAGSVFKRPPGYYVGQMMEELDLKGHRVGGAQLSSKHGGFIVNLDQASGADILELIAHIKAVVSQRFGIDLQQEQVII